MKPQTPSSQTAAVKLGCVEGPPSALSKCISPGALWLLGLSPGLGQSEWRGWEATHRTAATQGRGPGDRYRARTRSPHDTDRFCPLAQHSPRRAQLLGTARLPPGCGVPLGLPESLVSFPGASLPSWAGRKNLPWPEGVRGTGTHTRCRTHRNSLCYLYEFSVNELF